MINYLQLLNNNSEKEANKEFVKNLKEIYKKENKDNNNSNVNMKILWRWIKYLISNNNKIKNEIKQNVNILQNIEIKNNFYKQSCDEIINTYGINNINKFDEFIHALISKNNISRKRMIQLKKMLEEDCGKNKNNP